MTKIADQVKALLSFIKPVKDNCKIFGLSNSQRMYFLNYKKIYPV